MQLQCNCPKERLEYCWRIAGRLPIERRSVLGTGRADLGPLARPARLSLNCFVVRVPGRPRLGASGARLVEHGIARAHDAQVLGSECRALSLESRKLKLQIDEIVGERREFAALPFQPTFVKHGLVVEVRDAAHRSAMSPPFIDSLSPRQTPGSCCHAGRRGGIPASVAALPEIGHRSAGTGG